MMTKKPTCFEFRAILDRAELSPYGFGFLCGVSLSTSTRWCEGKLPIPRYAWVILSMHMGIDSEEIINGKLYRMEIAESDVFPEGYTREDYLRLMRRFHPDNVHERTRDFLGEVQILNEIKEQHRQAEIAAGKNRGRKKVNA